MKTAHPSFAQLATVIAGTLMLVIFAAFVSIPMSLTALPGDAPAQPAQSARHLS